MPEMQAGKIIRDFAPSIIVCATDNIALGAMKQHTKMGYKYLQIYLLPALVGTA